MTMMVIHSLPRVLNLAHGKQMLIPAPHQDLLCLSKAMSLPNLSFLTSHWILYFMPSLFSLATHIFLVKILAVGSGKAEECCCSLVHELLCVASVRNQSRVSKFPSLISNAQWFITVPVVLSTLYIQLYILGKEIYFLSDVKAFVWHDGNLWVVTPSSSPRTQESNSWQGMRRAEQSLQTEPNGHGFLLTGDIYGFANILVEK